MLSESLLNNQTNNQNKPRDATVSHHTSDVISKNSSAKEHSTDVQTTTEKISENFPAAACFYLISMAFSSSQSIFGKVLYEEQPTLSTY